MSFFNYAAKSGRMACLSIVSYLVNISLFFILVNKVGLPSEVGAPLAMFMMFFLNFFGCRHFVYSASAESLSAQVGGFGVATLVFRICELLLLYIISRFTGWDGLWVYSVVLCTSAFIKTYLYGRFIFS